MKFAIGKKSAIDATTLRDSAKSEELTVLWTRLEETRMAFLDARDAEKALFDKRFSGVLTEVPSSHQEWVAHLQIVQNAFTNWQDAVNAYLDALRR